VSTTGKLSPKRELFVQQYYATGDAFASYDLAGLPKRANYQAQRLAIYRLRTNPAVKARLREMAEASLENLKERRGKLVDHLNSILSADISDYIDSNGTITNLKSLSLDQRFAVKCVKVTNHGRHLELYDKMKAIELLARISGLMVDKVDVTSNGKTVGQGQINVVFEVVTKKDPKDVTESATVHD